MKTYPILNEKHLHTLATYQAQPNRVPTGHEILSPAQQRNVKICSVVKTAFAILACTLVMGALAAAMFFSGGTLAIAMGICASLTLVAIDISCIYKAILGYREAAAYRLQSDWDGTRNHLLSLGTPTNIQNIPDYLFDYFHQDIDDSKGLSQSLFFHRAAVLFQELDRAETSENHLSFLQTRFQDMDASSRKKLLALCFIYCNLSSANEKLKASCAEQLKKWIPAPETQSVSSTDTQLAQAESELQSLFTEKSIN